MKNVTKKLWLLVLFTFIVIGINANTVISIKSGLWSDPTTWNSNIIPVTGDHVIIDSNTYVYLDINVSAAGIEVKGILNFVSQKTITLQSTQNIIVTGGLSIQPFDPNSVQTIRFIGINETKFVGGGMDPIASDIGLWVVRNGVLNLQGESKTAFVNAADIVSSNQNTVVLKDSTYGWQPDDEIVITPTAYGSRDFDQARLQAISGSGKVFTTTTPFKFNHPVINNMWTAEVINLTRNVRIEGAVSGRTHLFIRSTQPQVIKNVQFRYVGPRKNTSGGSETEFIVGRYGIHFHHCMDGSYGSIIEGCVVRDAGSHAYVPHMSDGITMSNNVAYNCTETPFWWDLPDATNNVSWLHNIVANLNFVQGSVSFDTPGAPTLGVHGFVIGLGDENVAIGNVVVGQVGLETVNAAYEWEEMPIESAWTFKDNISHNNDCGLRGWQNNQKNHVIENVVIYNCNVGVLHGAYGNNYTYSGGYLYGNEFQDHAGSQENGVRLEGVTLDGGGIINYPFHMVSVEANIKGQRPILLINCILKNGKLGAVLDESKVLKNIDLINCNITGVIKNTSTVETIRVQPLSGAAYKVMKSGTISIANFAPKSWGSGDGLLGSYYNGVNFNISGFTRIDPIVLFEEWNTPIAGNVTGVHYAINSTKYSVRYTGYIEPQYTEPYTFYVNSGGGVRVYVNNVLVINKWTEPYPTTYTSIATQLTAGKRVPIKIEYFNTDDKSNLSLYWKSTSLKKEIVPQSQLYSN